MYQIQYHESNYRKEASLAALLHLMQAEAKISAAAYGFSVESLAENGLAWVLSRLYVECVAYPKVGEMIKIVTHPIEMGRFLTQRDYWLYDRDNQCVVSATSQWIVFDLEKRAMISIPKTYQDVPLPTIDNAYPPLKTKLYLPQKVDFSKKVTVHFYHIDFNFHTNNVAYVQWLSEAVPDAILWNYQIENLDISFRSESVLHDELLIETQFLDNDTFSHRIFRSSDQKDIVWAKTKWRKAGA